VKQAKRRKRRCRFGKEAKSEPEKEV